MPPAPLPHYYLKPNAIQPKPKIISLYGNLFRFRQFDKLLADILPFGACVAPWFD
jgi:hypothetical protein